MSERRAIGPGARLYSDENDLRGNAGGSRRCSARRTTGRKRIAGVLRAEVVGMRVPERRDFNPLSDRVLCRSWRCGAWAPSPIPWPAPARHAQSVLRQPSPQPNEDLARFASRPREQPLPSVKSLVPSASASAVQSFQSHERGLCGSAVFDLYGVAVRNQFRGHQNL